MEIRIEAPWRDSYENAVEDQKKLIALFGMQYGYGMKTILVEDGKKEMCATAEIDLSKYNIQEK
jgi:hypothetical protein